MVLSVPNNGAIDGLRDDDVVEITCDIRSDGAHPVRIGAIDEFQLQQIKRLKYFERCTIQAILEDDRDAGRQRPWPASAGERLRAGGDVDGYLL